MIEEPYRWVEAIANRREYIETQLAAGSPIAAVGYSDGILFLTLGQRRQKIFEIYDRVAMGAIGHPGDIERVKPSVLANSKRAIRNRLVFIRDTGEIKLLRIATLDVAMTEGSTRPAATF